jgi:hypothetical protein
MEGMPHVSGLAFLLPNVREAPGLDVGLASGEMAN